MVLPSTGELVCVLRVIDDHSRMSLASRACPNENATAWAVIQSAIDRHGPPAMFLTDGGTAFTSRRAGGGISDVEARLRALHVNPVVASPRHPRPAGRRNGSGAPGNGGSQPNRAQRAPWRSCSDSWTPTTCCTTPSAHQGIGGSTPADRYAARPKAAPSSERSPALLMVADRKVTSGGRVELGQRHTYNLGADWTGTYVTVVRDDLDVVILHGMTILTRLTIDPTRRAQRRQRPVAPRPSPPPRGAGPSIVRTVMSQGVR